MVLLMFEKYTEKTAHSLRKENSRRNLNKLSFSLSAQLPVAKECSPALSSACIRSQEDTEMNVFHQKNLQRTGHVTFSLAMRRLM